MKITVNSLLLPLSLAFCFSLKAMTLEQLTEKSWYSGAENCRQDQAPAIEIQAYDQNTYILRQNKCLHYEAPFMYLLFGEKQALLIDTGATADKTRFPLADTLRSIIAIRQQALGLTSDTFPLLVAHSHSHSDHIAGDGQFTDFNGARVIAANDKNRLMSAFGLTEWPEQQAQLDLGNRRVDIIATPGHQKEAVSFYDHSTRWLLTGDTLYPGRLYVRQWQEYKNSIARLVNFSKSHEISAVLGAHIEMSSRANQDYATGSTYQPDEASLVLTLADLYLLNKALTELADTPKKTGLGKFIIYPLEQAD
ncbi:MBL fold metallo-hydrolase [Thalassomonas viridans]|uniref:MBL fold metallo-hydrolase n=1 Tax=Thalassomonas viridans TaxID=137584 RepID=A0AAE9ZAR2_9GAMM|nr:MBL fold metallo-hydrolase [Thalassomonas viridans]WDE08897.1 MBL fold metallo-hydrolase [Thalassomonas viridans]WDE08944.1 MBL fold metallo-hydrolase [Thalassomonas viridans]